MIGLQPDMEIVGEVDNGRAAVELALTVSPDVVLMDIMMPELNGIEATRQIGTSRSCPEDHRAVPAFRSTPCQRRPEGGRIRLRRKRRAA